MNVAVAMLPMVNGECVVNDTCELGRGHVSSLFSYLSSRLKRRDVTESDCVVLDAERTLDAHAP
jgi:hypothetical protein